MHNTGDVNPVLDDIEERQAIVTDIKELKTVFTSLHEDYGGGRQFDEENQN